ncbi:cutinase family protein [Saccharomonospora azurea]|uniref:PE-PPE domain-containing protein n=1 Tax=Saccharomonospora azurea NA-128 TaxID=882081 RepID=H8GFA3_9PSEU|nr:PE-PPE domain-containing protein [Saccharomonospora azurea]EHK80141.1 PE-PPE domain-containing protein [Saccharomonospora azurea SZMC 14600]EHK86593.1 PE-PPE domain-containing protein [Saccharomonospora azurea SZMC 14600]EHY89002.1 PE-PPE domain-containing protein [Saccharomonospora azurea NA-128]
MTRIRKGRAALLATVAATTLAGVPVANAAAETAENVATNACPDTAVFEVDGYGHGEELTNWNNTAFNANPPAGWEIVPVPYHDGVFPGMDEYPLDAAVADGAGKLDAAVRDFHARCSGTRLVLAGYSEGAVVAGNVLESLAKSTDIPHELINGVLYGNPRRAFGDGGAGGVAGGIETNLPTILPDVTMQGPHDFGDLSVADICNENDGICNSTNMITNLAAFANGLVGYASGDHGYVLDPAADLGKGRVLHRQPQRVPHGPPLPIPVGTPWQIQQLLGDGPAARDAVRTARNGLAGLVGQETLDRLAETSPWYNLVKEA